MTDAAPLPDPSAALETVFRAVAERMAGLPIVNPALGVEAVGFAPWDAHWLGVMVTPWFMNLVLAPRQPACWRPLAPGAKQTWRFPAGDYEFIGAQEPGVGEFQICSLFSPVLEFEDAPTARFVAEHARAALLDAANLELQPPTRVPVDEPRPGPLARAGQQLEAPMSRREVLAGRFLPPLDDDRR
jgi:[NiFe] hydrogenase assembly HybE family chaperone